MHTPSTPTCRDLSEIQSYGILTFRYVQRLTRTMTPTTAS